jgi:hypothetical protein
MAAMQCPFCGTYFKKKFGDVLLDGTIVCKSCKLKEMVKILQQGKNS